VRHTERVKYVDDEPEEQAQGEENGADTREVRSREQTLRLLVDDFGCGTETRDWWNHEPA
jgi:hypothetical protein